MRIATALLWKEWREARPYLLIGLGLFLGMPLVQLAMAYGATNFRPAFNAAYWVVPLGGVLAVFTAVGVTSGDLRPGVADFWRSRPIDSVRWLLVKFAVGLAVVVLACATPLVVEQLVGSRERSLEWTVVAVLPFVWAAIFGLAFTAGCLVARPAHAAAIGLAGMLLIYVVPVIVPPLAWLNPIQDEASGPRVVVAVAGMVGVAVASVVVAAVAVRRGWRVESGRRLLYGLVGVGFLLLFASAAFQLGTNLPVLQTIDLPADERFTEIIVSGKTAGYAVSSVADVGDHRPSGAQDTSVHYRFRRVSIDGDGLRLGPVAGEYAWQSEIVDSPCRDGNDRVICYMRFEARDRSDSSELVVVDMGRNSAAEMKWPRYLQGWREPILYCEGDSLYVIDDRVRIVDIRDPRAPRLVWDRPNPISAIGPEMRTTTGLRIPITPLPGLTSEQCLEAAFGRRGFDGQYFCETDPADREAIVAYRLTGVAEGIGTFDRVGRYRPTALQRQQFGLRYGGGVANGRIYLVGEIQRMGRGQVYIAIAPDRQPSMADVGHFSVPGSDVMCLLADGRAIVGQGNHVLLVAAPKR